MRTTLLWLIGVFAPLGIGLASGPVTHTPEFFATPIEPGALIAGDDFALNTQLASTLLYLHLSGRFSEQHATLFERYLDRSRPPATAGSPVLEWRQRARDAGGDYDYVDARKLITRQSTRNGTQTTETHYIENCANDAFVTAIDTLVARRERYGQASPAFRRWLEAQQQVFDNCASPTLSVPGPPEDGWSELERHDRRYQIAASTFYGLEYQRAAELFGAIAADPASPWSDISRYLVARSLVRDAEVNGNDVDANLDAGLALYREMAADPDTLERFPSAAGMVRYLEIKGDQPGFLRQLAADIVERPGAVDTGALDDFLFLTEHGSFDSRADGNDEAALLRWHRLAADRSSAATGEIADEWQRTQNPAYLYLALARSQDGGNATPLAGYRAALAGLDASTPAYGEMQVMLTSRLLTAGDATLARETASALLADAARDDGIELTGGQRNRLQYVLAQTSTDPSAYLDLARLRPVAMRISSSRFVALDTAVLQQATRGSNLLTDETVRLINDFYTPTMLLDAIDRVDFGDYLRGRLVIAAWVKALLLEDEPAARRAAEILKAQFPSLEPELDQYLQGDDADFVAARIILLHPGFSPWVPTGIGRYRAAGDGSDLVFPSTQVALGLRRYNWWCDESSLPFRNAAASETTLAAMPMFSELPRDQLARMAGLRTRLSQSATERFGPDVVDYARRRPNDARVPRTLHRLVFATHYACRSGPGDVSRAAFEILHRDYPDSEWTRETPYWFE